MVIRACTAADQTAARALILEGLGERFGSIDETLNPDLNDIAANYLAVGHVFLVAEVAGTLVGTAALRFEPDEGATCQLVRVSVRSEMRRQGTARALVEALMTIARERGCASVWVETHEPWHDAIALYERLGFVEYAQRDGLVFLRRKLDASPVAGG